MSYKKFCAFFMASIIFKVTRVLATSWTRTIWAPFKIAAATEAWVPLSTIAESSKKQVLQ